MMILDREPLIAELIEGAVRAAGYEVCECCGAVTVDPEHTARVVMQRLRRVRLRIEGEPVPFSGG